MKIKIIKETRPGFTKIVQFTEGEIQFGAESRPSGTRHFIVATGKKQVQLTRDFATRGEAERAWQEGFDVVCESDSLELARKLVEEGIVEERKA